MLIHRESSLNWQKRTRLKAFLLFNTIVLDSRDWSEIVHIFEISHFKNNLIAEFTQTTTLNQLQDSTPQ